MVRRAVEKANDSVFHVSQTQPQCQGMGTTIVAAYYHDNKVAIAHVSDSRVYRLRAGRMEQITKDHSFVQELVDKGLFTKEEARTSSKKNAVTRAMGVVPYVEVEVHEHSVEVGDIYLMCSDGLHDLVPDVDISTDEFKTESGYWAGVDQLLPGGLRFKSRKLEPGDILEIAGIQMEYCV